MNDKDAALPSSAVLTLDDIRHGLICRIARILNVDEKMLNGDDVLAEFGLESLEGFTLSGELSDWLGFRLAPMLAWDFRTIHDLAAYLYERRATLSPQNELDELAVRKTMGNKRIRAR